MTTSRLFGILALSCLPVLCPATPLPTNAAGAINALGDDLHARALVPGEANLCLSPYSAATALAMTWLGAGGATRAEIGSVLHWQGMDDPGAGFGQIAAGLAAVNAQGKIIVETANGVWLQQDFPFTSTFLSEVASAFEARLELVDFPSSHETARVAINDWVARQTRQMIAEILPSGVLTADTRFVLVNSLYLKAPWKVPFQPQRTRDGDFHVSAGETITVRLMQGEFGHAPILQADTFTLVSLPFHGDALSMVVAMPSADRTLDEFRASFGPAELEAALQAASTARCVVHLPRFRVESAIPLNSILQDLGMSSAFTEGVADFTALCGEAARGQIVLTDVRQKAVIEVTEFGVEAAAATSVTGGITSVPPSLVFDRPFLYFVRDSASGAVLFRGQVTRPVNPEEVSVPQAFYELAPLLGWFVRLEDGWMVNTPIGDFTLEHYPWIQHADHGWMLLFMTEQTASGLWLWQPDHGWLWSSITHYPLLWSQARGGWLYFAGGAPAERWFYDFSSRDWIVW